MNNLSPVIFNFVSQTLRVVTIDGNPWFVAADVCGALEHSNVSQALKRLDDDEQALISNEGIHRGSDQVNVVNESGLYSLILGSRKPEAKKFKKWVTSEVLPAIRKTGGYTHVKALPVKVTPADPLLGATGDYVINEYCGYVRNYVHSPATSISAAIRACVKNRFGVLARNLPLSKLPELLDLLEGFGADCYRFWWGCCEVEYSLLRQAAQRTALHSYQLPLHEALCNIEVPNGPHTMLRNIRDNSMNQAFVLLASSKAVGIFAGYELD